VRPGARPRVTPRLLVLLRLELLRLARTREVTTFLMLPALLFVPIIVAITLGLTTLRDDRSVVALPLDSPAELDLDAALADNDLTPLWTADPAGAFRDGEAMAAVLQWESGEGIGGARPRFERARRWRWRATAVAWNQRTTGRLEAAITSAGDEALRDWVAAGGHDPEALLDFAIINSLPAQSEDAPDPIPFIDGPGGLAIVLLMVAVLSQYLVPVIHVSDRLAGVAESLAVTPAGRGSLLVARLLAFTLVEMLAAALVVGNLHLLLSALPGRSLPSLASAPAVVCGALFINAAFLAVSLPCNNVQQAVSRASILLVVLGALAGVGAQLAQPALPFAGLFSAEDDGSLLLASLSCLLGAALLTAVAARLFTGARALPPSGT